jgi:hypothetical protein
VLDQSGSSLVFSESGSGLMQLLPLNDIVTVKPIEGTEVGWQIVLRSFEVKFDSKTSNLRDEWVSAVKEASKRVTKPKVEEEMSVVRAQRRTDNALKTAMKAKFESAEHRRKENSEKRASLAAKYGRNGTSNN